MTNANVPSLTPEQRAKALEKAREARARRAELKEALASGALKMSELLELDDPATRKMKVDKAVMAMPGYGPAKTEALLSDIDIAAGKRIGGLGSRQKDALVKIFG